MFVSYAQNFEDVILWRALKHIENGFYVDIGAQDPIDDSVSRGFYEQGWRGVHVEPAATYATRLRDNRPDEEVIQAAIGNGGEDLRFFEIPETGLSTGDQEIAETHKKNGLKVLETKVPLQRLSTLLERIGAREIHWLKIDVEGMEKEVIDTWSPSKARPWIVVVESTLPNSQVAAFAKWEPQLVNLGYEYVYFDGLSRFYVSIEHKELAHVFGPGPNCFDAFHLAPTSGFIDASVFRSGLAIQLADRNRKLRKLTNEIAAKASVLQESESRAAERIAELQTAYEEAAAAHATQLAERDRKLRKLENEIAAKSGELLAVHASRSWRITWPFRAAGSAARMLAGLSECSLRMLLEHILLWLQRRPRWKAQFLRLVRPVPALERRLLKFASLTGDRNSVVLPMTTDAWAIEPDPAVLAEWKKIAAQPSARTKGKFQQ